VRGRLIVPVMEGRRQRLILLEKTVDAVGRKSLADVLYVSLQGRYGVRGDPWAS
jgi:protein-L-isoaspartate O-methyltransferase